MEAEDADLKATHDLRRAVARAARDIVRARLGQGHLVRVRCLVDKVVDLAVLQSVVVLLGGEMASLEVRVGLGRVYVAHFVAVLVGIARARSRAHWLAGYRRDGRVVELFLEGAFVVGAGQDNLSLAALQVD